MIKVPQLGKEITVEKGTSLMKSLLAAGIPVASSCNGDGICGKCKMTVVAGAKGISEPNDLEKILKEKYHLQAGVRISCQVVVDEDIEVKTTYW